MDLILDFLFFSAIRLSTACWGGSVILRAALGGLNAAWIMRVSFVLRSSLFASWVLCTCASSLRYPASVISCTYNSPNLWWYCAGKVLLSFRFRVSWTLVSLLLTFCPPWPVDLAVWMSHSLFRITVTKWSILTLEYRYDIHTLYSQIKLIQTSSTAHYNKSLHILQEKSHQQKQSNR